MCSTIAALGIRSSNTECFCLCCTAVSFTFAGRCNILLSAPTFWYLLHFFERLGNHGYLALRGDRKDAGLRKECGCSPHDEWATVVMDFLDGSGFFVLALAPLGVLVWGTDGTLVGATARDLGHRELWRPDTSRTVFGAHALAIGLPQ